MKAEPELTPEEKAKAERKAKAEAEMKRKKEELLARKAAKKAAAEGGGAAPAPGGAGDNPEGQARPRVSSASRRRGTAFVKPDAVPDAHDIAEMEKNEGVKDTSKGGGKDKPPMERRGTGFVNKQQVADHAAANDEQPKKKSSMCIVS